MTFTQKAKYFVYGVIATAVLVPLGTYAIKTIPLTFAEGDVISASVLNALMGRIENATSPLTADDLVGTWTLTQIFPSTGEPGNDTCNYPEINSCTITGTVVSADGMSRSRTDTVKITKNGSTYNYEQSKVSSLAHSRDNYNSPESGSLSVIGESILFKNSKDVPYPTLYYFAKKISSNHIVLHDIYHTAGVSLSRLNVIVLKKLAQSPAPADALTSTVSGTSVALAWTDQSIDETGFKVQYKTSAKGSWTTASTTAANATSYTITGLTAGTYWIRVIAINTYGDSISSSEVQAVLP
jgi:hypothetical protein